jgi:hypothetical protein
VQQFANVFNFFISLNAQELCAAVMTDRLIHFLKSSARCVQPYCNLCAHFVSDWSIQSRVSLGATCFRLNSLDLTYNFCVFLCDCVYSSLLLRRRFILNKSVAAETHCACTSNITKYSFFSDTWRNSLIFHE